VKRKGQVLSQELDYALNWPIKLRELSIRLQEKSHGVVKEAIKLYMNGLIDRESLIEIIRLSGLSLHKYVDPRKYVEYEGEDTIEDTEELVADDFEKARDAFREVHEEYVGESVIKRLMVNDR
jgi:hypothetical protein